MPNTPHPLSWEALKGTKTAIHCKTKDQWQSVSDIMQYCWHPISNWRTYKSVTCLSCNGMNFSHLDYYREGKYRIIPACDFIAANTVGDKAIARDDAKEHFGKEEYLLTLDVMLRRTGAIYNSKATSVTILIEDLKGWFGNGDHLKKYTDYDKL